MDNVALSTNSVKMNEHSTGRWKMNLHYPQIAEYIMHEQIIIHR